MSIPTVCGLIRQKGFRSKGNSVRGSLALRAHGQLAAMVAGDTILGHHGGDLDFSDPTSAVMIECNVSHVNSR